MKIEAKVKRVCDTVVVSDKFKKREVVVETIEQYPQVLLLQTSQAKCDLLDSAVIGRVGSFHLNLRGREWSDKEGVVKIFNTIEIWKIEWSTTASSSAAEKPDLPF